MLSDDIVSDDDMREPLAAGDDCDGKWLAEHGIPGVDVVCERFERVSVKVSDYSNDIVFDKDTIVLDTAAGESIFRDAELFFELGVGEPIVIDGINENGAPIYTTQWGYTTLGSAYLAGQSVGNILSFGKVVDEAHYVWYESDTDMFYVQMERNGRVYQFDRNNPANIYITSISNPTNSFGSRARVLVNTVQENMSRYTKREIARAASARDYQRKLGYTAGQLIGLLNSGKIRNAEVTAHDVVRSIDIWGKDLGQLKGKTTAKKPGAIKFEPLLKLQQDQVMDIDLMFVEDLIYMVSVFSPLDYTSVKKLKSKSKYDVWSGVSKSKAHVERAGLKIPTARCDGESAVASSYVEQKMASASIQLDTVASGDAVPKVERKIRVIKERVRGVINTLPFLLSLLLIDWLVQYCVYRINGEISSDSTDKRSPHERLYGRVIDARTDLKHAFGDYVQVSEGETDNSMQERTRGAIALMPAGNSEGSWWYLILKTGKPVRRNNATPLPMPEEVIDLLNDMATSNRKSRAKAGEMIRLGSYRSAYYDDDNSGVADGDEAVDIEAYRPVVIEPQHFPDDDIVDNDAQPVEADEYIEDDHQALLDDIFMDEVFEEAGDHRGVQRIENDYEEQAEFANNAELASNVPVAEAAEQSEQPVVENQVESGYNLRPGRAKPGRWRAIVAANKNYTKTKREFMKREFGLHMTVRQGIDKLGYDAILSVVQELMSLNNMNTFWGMDVRKMSEDQLRRVITSKTFLKEKFTPEGIYERLKARLVAGGHLQSREDVDGTSPTPATEAVFMIAAIAAAQGRAVATVDFPSAFLLADIPDDAPPVYIELNRFETMVLCKIDPSYNEFVKPNGKCVVKLRKPLYGCIESARLWYEKICADLIDFGFVKNPYDDCVFNRMRPDGSQETIVIHVDDMMITAASEEAIDKIIAEIGTKYEKLTVKRGRKLDYLGMTFDFQKKGKCKITMEGFVSDVIDFCSRVTGEARTPAAADLFEINENSPFLSAADKQFFHSATAKLLYLSKRIRPDMLTAVSFLTKRVINPTEEDLRKLYRAIRYLRGSRELGIVLEPGNHISLYAFIDASYGVHTDMRGHSGCVVGVGKGPIYTKSSAQKLNTKSSTETELVALSDNTPQVIWCRNFLKAQGHIIGPATVYQDNMSTIALVKAGKSNSSRTRHIAIRFFFVSDRVKSGEIKVEYMRTGEMLADILTKPLQGELFRKLRARLLNWEE